MAGKNTNVIPLGSVVKKISRGIQLTSEQLGSCFTDIDTGYKYLALADIKDDFSLELNTDNLRSFDPTKLGKDVEQFCVKQNMLLLAKNDTPFKAQIAGDTTEQKIIVGGNIYMITVDEEKVIPRWLCYWLQSNEGMEGVRSAASVTSNGKMKWISIKQLESVSIPAADFQQQADYLTGKIKEYTLWIEKVTKEFHRVSGEITAIFESLGVNSTDDSIRSKSVE